MRSADRSAATGPILPTRLDDVLVAAALLVMAALCLSFRYLPLVDGPQHHAMVAILTHHRDPAFGFADRFTIDLVGRPYASVYVLAAGLAHVLPLAAAMRVVIALCTVAPLAGLYVLLRVLGRPRAAVLALVPLAFGAVWHWGFLNFELGTGLFLIGLAQAVGVARRPGWRPLGAFALLGVVLLFTHVHGLALLVGLGPLFAWAFGEGPRWRRLWRSSVPLLPAAAAGGGLVLYRWRQMQGTWEPSSPGMGERVRQLVPFLGGGLAEPWPIVVLALPLGALVVARLLAERQEQPERRRHALVLVTAVVVQIGLYFTLPLNTTTVAFVSPRSAFVAMLLLPLFVPELRPRWRRPFRGLVAAAAGIALVIVGRHLARFDREARDFDAVLEPIAMNRRVATLVFDRRGEVVHPGTFPYVHFGAYSQAFRGGDVLYSFARNWNMPVQYRLSPLRYRADERIVWGPQLFSAERDLPRFDYVIVRGGPPGGPPAVAGLERVAARGAFALYANPRALPPRWGGL